MGLRPPERKWVLEAEGFTAAMGGGGSLFQKLAAAKPRPDLILVRGKKPRSTFLQKERCKPKFEQLQNINKCALFKGRSLLSWNPCKISLQVGLG